MSSSGSYSWLDFIKMIFDFFMGRHKHKQEQKELYLKKTTDAINSQYNEVDKKKEENKQDATKDRLDNMF